MQFFEQLPGDADRPKRPPIDWAKAKADLIANEGRWGLIATDVSNSVPQQLRRGRNKQFRGPELDHFEFSVRKPENPTEPYPKRRSDLYGRYTR